MFFVFFTMTVHVFTCVWIIAAKMDPDKDNTWITNYGDTSREGLYTTALYYTITTITTVGYGDITPNTFLEKIIGIIIMIAGVVAFSLAVGALTNFISQSEFKSAQM